MGFSKLLSIHHLNHRSATYYSHLNVQYHSLLLPQEGFAPFLLGSKQLHNLDCIEVKPTTNSVERFLVDATNILVFPENSFDNLLQIHSTACKSNSIK